MCLAVPGKIIKIQEETATIDYDIEKRKANLLSSDFNVGDYVIVQGGIVLQKIPAKEAKEALKLYKKSLG